MNIQVFTQYICATLIVASHVANAASVTYSDGTFADSDWTAAILAQTGPSASFSAQQMSSGGNPGEFRNVQQTYGGPGDIIVGHWQNGAVYNPSSQGAISSISSAFDLILFNGGDSLTVAYAILLTQQGNSFYGGYTTTTIAPVRNVWIHNDLFSLSATDFTDVSGSSLHPDFSNTGGAIQLGFATLNGTGENRSTTTSSGIDNWSVTVAAVPLPATAWLFVSGLVWLFGSWKHARHLA